MTTDPRHAGPATGATGPSSRSATAGENERRAPLRPTPGREGETGEIAGGHRSPSSGRSRDGVGPEGPRGRPRARPQASVIESEPGAPPGERDPRVDLDFLLRRPEHPRRAPATSLARFEAPRAPPGPSAARSGDPTPTSRQRYPRTLRTRCPPGDRRPLPVEAPVEELKSRRRWPARRERRAERPRGRPPERRPVDRRRDRPAEPGRCAAPSSRPTGRLPHRGPGRAGRKRTRPRDPERRRPRALGPDRRRRGCDPRVRPAGRGENGKDAEVLIRDRPTHGRRSPRRARSSHASPCMGCPPGRWPRL